MTESNEQREAEITARARELWQQSVRDLDGNTRSRLAQARARAVEASAKRRFGWWLSGALMPLGGVAAAALVIAVIWQGPELATVAPIEPQVLTDLELLLDDEELELFEELEFYAWLLEQPELLAEDGGTG